MERLVDHRNCELPKLRFICTTLLLVVCVCACACIASTRDLCQPAMRNALVTYCILGIGLAYVTAAHAVGIQPGDDDAVCLRIVRLCTVALECPNIP
eukprot:688470-Amphidinium_carterae.3